MIFTVVIYLQLFEVNSLDKSDSDGVKQVFVPNIMLFQSSELSDFVVKGQFLNGRVALFLTAEHTETFFIADNQGVKLENKDIRFKKREGDLSEK
ncbi:hypothetical protein Smp_145160 [Schistosoma mansoni]|uniref:hypothetical protein n=1 Tax=Schistosoma mansoni TaxID=6183 RepID=UPI0001A63D80|nr:hypothetical protein Smp_145160 [Schistosoma mansoni]|eukprot:XP_018652157.1 hypothetical protein Smp_145160 [Schistosoma mansoni]